MNGLSEKQIAGCFNRGLGTLHQVRLIGGAAEPFYQPAAAGRPAIIRYTRDYAASALHELAHWCIAGADRRRRPDYGYWYRPPPRSISEQAAFFRVEVPVQALEARFCAAAGLPFRVSMDDLAGADTAHQELCVRVSRQLRRDSTVPPRAACLIEDLRRLRRALGGGNREVPGYPDAVEDGEAA